MKKICAFTLIILLGFTLTIARAQSASSPQDEPLRIKADLVQIDVVVTDKNNRPVLGLKKEDFILQEDGKPQEISFFALHRASGAGATEAQLAEAAKRDPSLAPEPGRFIFIILDQYNISPTNRQSLRESLLRFIAEDVGSQDHVAIIGTSGSLVVFQQATRNRRAQELAIEAFLSVGPDLKSALAVDQALNDAQKELGLTASQSGGAYQEYILRKTLSALRDIAKGVSELPGRKIAIFVSENLPFQFTSSAGIDDNISYELTQVISRSRRGGLTFYTVDPRGLAVAIPSGTAAEAVGKSALGGGTTSFEDPGASADRLISSRGGMRELAAATGGFSIFDTNNVRAGLQRIMTENEAYYMLAYYPQNASPDGKFHNIKVRVKDQPDLVVRTRKGYTAVKEKDQKPKSDSKQDRISRSLASLAPVRNVKVVIARAAAMSNPQTGERSVKMAIQIDPRSLSFLEGGNNKAGSFEVIGFIYDLKNKLVEGFSQTFKPNPESYQRLLARGIVIPGEIKLKKAGLYNIRVVVIDQESGEMGTASEWIEAK
ncbi:MAG TPA: VWA domain-containing protein [Blastocatellia bacterium]|nr:VWA domain-containing protein [Blastocatellia bacterium]